MDPRYEDSTADTQQPTDDSAQGIQIGTEQEADEPQEMDFQSFKLIATEAHLMIKRLKEPKTQLIQIRMALHQAIQTDRMGTDAEFSEWISTLFGIRLMPQLTREKSNDDEYLDVCADVLESWILLFLDQTRKKRFHERLICATTWCFQPISNLHQNHFQYSSAEMRQIVLGHQIWRNDIVFGSQLDVMVTQDGISCWLLGKVVHLQDDHMQIEFEHSSPDYDMMVDRWSTKIAPAGQESTADVEWRRAIFLDKIDVVCDAHDGSDWMESTVFETQMRETTGGRIIPMCLVGFRVYRTTGKKLKKDAHGVFEGWGKKYDEWVAMFSPYLARHLTRTVSGGDVGIRKLDTALDDHIQPTPGFKTVYACPRINQCISKKFLYFLDMVGNSGGYDVLLDVMENGTLGEGGLDLTCIGYMITLISMSSKLWHKAFIEDYGPRFCNAIEKRFLESDDKTIRELDQQCSYQAIQATQGIRARFMPREEAIAAMEVFKLKFIKKCLESQFLEKRIQGIKELNEIVRESTIGNDAEATTFIVKWIIENGVFQIIWDPRKTHIQLVQRSDDIVRCFCRAGLMTEELMAQFWNLTNSDYKVEVFKILNEVDYSLEQPQIEFIFNRIKETQATKLGIEDLDILAMLGRRSKDVELNSQISMFFWRYISNSEAYNLEVVDSCVNKFADMIKYWAINHKQPFFAGLVLFLKNNSAGPTIPVLKLFQRLVVDHKDRERLMAKQSTTTSGINYGNAPSKWVEPVTTIPVEVRHVFDVLEQQHQFSTYLLNNLSQYFNAIKDKAPLAGKLTGAPRTELKIFSAKYSHHEELDERLKFVQMVAANSSFELTRVHLKVIFDQLASSPVSGDIDEFLKWCKAACESNLTQSVVDLNEFGEFFSEQIASGVLDLRSMPLTGFYFIQMFFVSSNVAANNILQTYRPKKKKETARDADWGNYQVFWDDKEDNQATVEEEDKDTPYFTVYGDPAELEHLDIIWQIALKSEVEQVFKPAVSLLVYSQLSAENSHTSEDQRSAQVSAFLAKCFDLMKPEANPTAHIVSRVTMVLKEVIQQSEKSGMLDIRPHRSILKGELFDRIIIRFMSKPHSWADERVERAFIVKLYTSCTVWQFKSEVAKLLGLAPKYIEFEFPGKKIIEEKQHGFDMQELGLKNNDIITTRKVTIDEFIPEAALVDPETQWLVPRAEQIFTEWFEYFKNPLKSVMDNFSVARFISKTTGSSCISSDETVIKLIRDYDYDGDNALSLTEFLQFYYDAAELPGSRREACFDNLTNMNVRPDLVKLAEVVDKALFSRKQLMPRFALQANAEQYETLWKLLERKDDSTEGVWELIRMLATNDRQYMEVIRMETNTNEDGQIDWATFFQGNNVYQKIYQQEIILSVLEDSEGDSSNDCTRVMLVAEQKISASSYQYRKDDAAPAAASTAEEEIDEEEVSRQAESAELRLNWSRNFLERGGLQHIMQEIYALDVASTDKKQTEFMFTLARVFLTGAFATDPQKQIGQAMRLTRKSSSIDDGDALDKKTKKKEQSGDKIQELLRNEFGMEILLSTNYSRLQAKILSLVQTLLQQDVFSLEDKIIIENAITIWVGASLYKPELFDDFRSFNQDGQTAEDFILSGLVFCQEDKTRQDFCAGILALSRAFEPQKRQLAQQYFMGILGSNFLKVASQPCNQYFDLFNQLIDLQVLQDGLIDEFFGDQAGIRSYDPETLLGQMIDKILASQAAIDETQAEDAADEVTMDEGAQGKERLLVGLITLTQKIIQTADKEISDRVIQGTNLVNQMFKQFLFVSYFQKIEESKNEEQKEVELVQRCGKKQQKVLSNKRSREAAFSLQIELLRKSESSFESFLNHILTPMLESIDKPRTWRYQPPSKDGGEGGRLQEFVGLRNLGCICYMNSMMQQFFMIPCLRYNLLCTNDEKPEELVEYKNKVVDDNMFHQMQRLFAHLELSERMDYNPFPFCFAFKEFDGAPTITSEQKDAQEFLNLLFDRLETALKPTNRKYLLQGIFGGKQISQMVCTECGKVKNRHEDFLNLSLNIKDIKTVYESLQKQIEGEIINDYNCDGCNRKVDLSKRTLISETPNILIVHLQRIGFNFETFETDKVNTLCKFPKVLDLKPYSFFEVMGKENRLKEQQEKGEGSVADTLKKKEELEALTEEELEKRREIEEETREPEREDCFEYKLVGVNVHSGTANMGHYWSYINTNRGTEEKEGDTQWIRTDQDPWMEFNDSRVTPFDFKELEKQCFGNEQGAGFMGDSYGTSGYMLFYERRTKKPLKIIVSDDKVEEEKANGIEVHFDEEKKESYKNIPYYDTALGEKANPIYQQVFTDNHNVKFENDIYSQEFLDFVLNVLHAAASTSSKEAKLRALRIGKKVGFDILARCLDSSGISQMHEVMIKILKSSDEVCSFWMEELIDEDDAEPVLEILFDCEDTAARRNLIKVIRYLVCRLKEIEKDLVLSQAHNTITENYIDEYGAYKVRTLLEPRALVLKFMSIIMGNMSIRAARNWKQIDTYLELLLSFGAQSAADIEKEVTLATKPTWDKESVGYRVGMTELLRKDFLSVLGDFILQDASPLHKGENDIRMTMGNYYIQPEFVKGLLLCSLLMAETGIQKTYPLTEDARTISHSKGFLQQMLKANNSYETSGVDFSEMLNIMCVDNIAASKKMAKAYVRELLNKNHVDDIEKGLKSVRSFLQIKDTLRIVRFEWVFGVPQLISKRNHQRKSVDLGVSCISYINQEAYSFKSGIVKGLGEGLLSDMFRAQRTRVEFTIHAMLELLKLCVEDEQICQFIYGMPPPSYQFSCYCDWFEPFATEQRKHLIETGQRYSVYQDMQNKQNVEMLTEIISILPLFKEKCAKYELKWRSERAAANPEDFDGWKKVCMAGQNEEVIDHYPPQYIIGQALSDARGDPVAEFENEAVVVRMFKVEVEYMYGNPTGLYNLSLPDRKLRNYLNYKAPERTYAQWKREQSAGVASDLDKQMKNQKTDDANDDGTDGDEYEEDYEGLDVRHWNDHSLVTELYQVQVENKGRDQVKVEVSLEAEDENEVLNCTLPVTSFYNMVLGSGISARPVTTIITKIDPSKPLGKLKMSVSTKTIRTALGGNYAMATGPTGQRTDPTYAHAYRECIDRLKQHGGNLRVGGEIGTGGQGVQFYINQRGDGDTYGEGETGDNDGRSNALNIGVVGVGMGDMDGMRHKIDLNEEAGEDGEAGYASNDNQVGSDNDDLWDQQNVNIPFNINEDFDPMDNIGPDLLDGDDADNESDVRDIENLQ